MLAMVVVFDLDISLAIKLLFICTSCCRNEVHKLKKTSAFANPCGDCKGGSVLARLFDVSFFQQATYRFYDNIKIVFAIELCNYFS